MNYRSCSEDAWKEPLPLIRILRIICTVYRMDSSQRETKDVHHIVAATMCSRHHIRINLQEHLASDFGDSISILSSLFWAAQDYPIAKGGGRDKDRNVHNLQFMSITCPVTLAQGFT